MPSAGGFEEILANAPAKEGADVDIGVEGGAEALSVDLGLQDVFDLLLRNLIEGRVCKRFEG